jgi:hypothetical protein
MFPHEFNKMANLFEMNDQMFWKIY